MRDAPRRSSSVTPVDQRDFLAASRRSWAIVGGLATITALGVLLLHVPVELGKLPLNLVVAAVFAPVGFVYATVRYDARVAGLCDSVALLCVYTFVAAIGTYVATAVGAAGPLWDERLRHADLAAGLDWRAYLAWLDAHPRLGGWLDTSYRSALLQVPAVLVVLTVAGRIRRLQQFVIALQVALLVCVAAPAAMPALGAYTTLHIVPAADHPHIPLTLMNGAEAQILQLRGPSPHIRLDEIEGIVVFPSFHTVLAILFVWALWPMPLLRGPILLLDGAMLAATPLSGGHYFVDLGAGALLAVASLAVARRLGAPRPRERRARAAAALPLSAA